jgi:hypothetical protein
MSCIYCKQPGVVFKARKISKGKVLYHLVCKNKECKFQFTGIDGDIRTGQPTWLEYRKK